MKYCTCCKQKKSLTEFHNNKSNKDGKQTYCKKCQKEYNYTWVKKRYKSTSEFYQKNKDVMDRSHYKYVEKHKDKIRNYNREYRRRYYWENRDKILKYNKEYNKNHYGNKT